MSCGAPVISSKVEPMPELCQNAAVYFDPFNPKDIADKIKTVLIDHNLIQKLKHLSLQRAGFFSWEETAKETLRVFERLDILHV